MLLIGNGRLITQNPDAPYFDDGCVAVDGKSIADFGTTKEMREKYPEAKFEDVKRKVIMPGLINTHTHIYSSFARGMSLDQPHPNRNFIEILENQWWRMDKALTLEDTKYSAYSTILESVRNGVTTLFDHHASPYHIENSLFTIGDAAKDVGVRASLCYEVSDRDGKEIANTGIKENMDFIHHANKDTSDMIKGMMGLHASFTISDETMDNIVSAMGSENAGYHVHVAEGIEDVYDSLQKYNKRIVNRLFDAKILTDKTIAVHCIHIDPNEMNMLKANDCMVVHNSESNMGNAVGCASILKLLDRGVLLGMGTDAYTQDMFESLRVANLIHKHHLCDPSVAFGETLQMLFENNRKIVGRFFDRETGVIKAGACADIVVADYNPHTPLNENTIGGHIMFGIMGQSIESTMINGEFVMKDRVILTVDEEKIKAEARQQAADFWKRV